MAGQGLRPIRPHPPEHQLERRFGPPPLPGHTVFRPRLFDALEQGCAKPLTLVSAPAGTGKTVAVASWLARDVVRPGVAWISLTENALASGSLLSLMAEALLPAGAMGGSAATPWTHAPTVANIVRGLKQRSGPVSLVLDCDVAITREEALQVHRILGAARDTLRMILISRADPPLPLHRYRLDDDIVEIRMNQLAFSAIEAAELLNRGGFDLPQAAVQLVMARTQGWAAGLLLAAMSLATRSDAVRAAQDLTGASGPVAEYLLAEVLNVQTPAIRTLLLRTSIVDELDRGVSEALAGDRAPAALVFLARGNAFLEEVTGSPGCYRYHPLFRELLLAQLRTEAPTELTRLHRIAAAWCSEHAQVGEAVRHAAQAGAWDEAARYVLDNLAVIRILKPAARDELGAVLTRMPREVSGVAPALVRAALLLRAGQVERAGRHLDIARRGLAPSSDDDAAGLALALLTVAHASRCADYAVLGGAVVLARQLSDRWTTGDALSRLGLESMLAHAHAKVCFIEGRWDAALETYTRIASGNVRAEDWPEVMDSIGHLALIAAWRGQNRYAVRRAREALSVETDTTNGSRSWAAAAAEAALAWVGVETCDVPCAKLHLANVESSLSSEVDLVTQVAVALVRSRVSGGGYGARLVLSTFLASHAGLPAWIIDLVTVELAAIELMGAAANDATSTSGDVPAPVREMASVVRTWGLMVVDASGNTRPPAVGDRSDSVTARVQRLVLTALWWLRRNDDDQAVKALQQALALAETENLRRPFREAPVEVRRMLRSHPDIAGCRAWLSARDGSEGLSDAGEGRRPLRAVPPERDRSQGNLLEPLTEREMQVLKLLGQLLTTDEIAAEMFVSVNTIRTHVRNILRKLSVSRRNEAIRRAREHGILQ